uniref:Uncharacterized protein n=1 Tax=Pithovirus LCPAC101 TaxID=2506586 RepID=A0A481Z579_9VIRU|nr:MAG: hypothetical protein LCPAC101_00830 [Pithovirus LCPAC101]
MELIIRDIISLFNEKYMEYVIDGGDGSNFVQIWFNYDPDDVYNSMIIIYNMDKIVHYSGHTSSEYTHSEYNILIHNINHHHIIYCNN